MGELQQKKLEEQLKEKEDMIRMTQGEAQKHKMELEEEMMRKASLENRLATEELNKQNVFTENKQVKEE